MNLKEKIRDVPDFPQKGIVFKDITPLLRDRDAFEYLIRTLTEKYKDRAIDVIAGIESRGFIIGGALAAHLGTGFIPIRKKAKLPWESIAESYEKEYGPDALEIHTDAVEHGQTVLVVDDLLATGGTAAAAATLIERLGGRPSFCFVVELSFLKGMEKLKGYEVVSLISY
jgi:adenine phosphoribosyltransferase